MVAWMETQTVDLKVEKSAAMKDLMKDRREVTLKGMTMVVMWGLQWVI